MRHKTRVLQCRLKNPSKAAAALATGNLAAALPYGMAAGGATSADGNGHTGGSSNGPSISNGAGVTLPGLAATTAAPSAVYGRVQGAESAGSSRSPSAVQADRATDQQQQPQQAQSQQGAGCASPSPVKAGAPGRSEAVRVLRQQLLLALGPWLQDNNATLTVIE